MVKMNAAVTLNERMASRSSVFFLSFSIMVLQISLALLFLVFSRLPLLALTIAFLGLTAGGVFTWMKNRKSSSLDFASRIFPNLFLCGVLQLCFPFVLKWMNAIRLDQTAAAMGVREIFLQQVLGDMVLYAVFFGLYYALLFFFAGRTLSMIYQSRHEDAPGIYAFDLAGAAAGCAAAVVLLGLLKPVTLQLLLGALFFAGALALMSAGRKTVLARISAAAGLTAVLGLGLFNLRTDFFEIRLSCHILARDYAGEKECREIWNDWNAYSRVGLVKFRAPGQNYWDMHFALNNSDGAAAVFNYQPENPYAHQEFTFLKLPFYVQEPENALVLLAGAGFDMLMMNSYSQGRTRVTGVEMNSAIYGKTLKLDDYHLPEFFERENIRFVKSEARAYLEGSREVFDSIVLSWSGASIANSIGTASYTTDYLYTREAFAAYLKHLTADGTLTVISFNKLKIMAALKEALKLSGKSQDLSQNVILLTDREKFENTPASEIVFDLANRTVLFYKKTPFSPDEVERIRAGSEAGGNVIVYAPGIEVERFGVFKEMMQTQNPRGMLRTVYGKYELDGSIPEDDRPFIRNYIKPGILFRALYRQLLNLEREPVRGLSFRMHFYTLTIFMVLAAAGLVFIIAPLLFSIRSVSGSGMLRPLLYFTALGMGYMCVEIALMQKLILYFGNPVYAFSVILACLLLSSGAGSFASARFAGFAERNIRRFHAAAAVLLAVYYAALPAVTAQTLAASLPFKIALTLLIIFPPGFLLGIFFPCGIRRLGASQSGLVPWAWAVNGYATMLVSMAAMYISLASGFKVFFAAAAVIYLTAGVFVWKSPSEKNFI